MLRQMCPHFCHQMIFRWKPRNHRLIPRTVVDAIKKSLRRKREPKADIEAEDIVKESATKKLKRDSNDLMQIPNGLLATNKQSVKRQAIDGTELFHKRFKNNEILSSYSSLQSLQLSQSLKNKRKLSPDSRESEVKTRRTVIPEEVEVEEVKAVSVEEPKPNWNMIVDDSQQFRFADNLPLSFNAINEESAKSVPKKSYGLPLHLHSMEDHERDRNKARNRLNRYLNAVKDMSSPMSESDSNETITTEITTESSATQISASSEIGLPQVPAAAIFTNSRVESTVTTTVLNAPISSVLTSVSTKESVSPSFNYGGQSGRK